MTDQHALTKLPTIAFDLDDTLSWNMKAVLATYNTIANDTLTYDDIKSWNCEQYTKPGFQDVIPNLFKSP